MKPFVKWVGGKKIIVKKLIEEFPDRSITSYYEPFLGGGALFFSIRNTHLQNSEIILNDVNQDLINCYLQVRDNVESVIDILQDLKYDKDLYYQIRSEYHEHPTESILRAAWFIYLNKCGFNGLYRVNKKGHINVPFGKYSKVNVCDEKTLRAGSEALQKVYLRSQSFNTLFEGISNPDGTLIYLDPPYFKEKENSFTSYTQYGFSTDDHILLRNTVDFLSVRGCSVLLSNSDTQFVRDLYENYTILEVVSRRSINRDGSGRKPKTELLIRNW